MILQRGWFKRRPRAVPAELVLDFRAVDLEATCEHGTYYVQRCAGDWEARFRPEGARLDARDLHVDALSGEGEHIDWPTRERAEDACRLHAHLLDLGYGVARATELVGARSQRVSRVPTLDYAEPVAAART